MPSLSPCDGKCGMDHAYIDFFMIKEGCLSEKPQMIIIQFILLLWFFIGTYTVTHREVLTYHNANKSVMF